MSNKNIYIFIMGIFYGGFFSIILRETFVLYNDIPFLFSSVIILWLIGTFIGLRLRKTTKLQIEKNIKNVIFWIYLLITFILYIFKLNEKIINSFSFQTILLSLFLISFSSILLSFLIKIILNSSSEITGTIKILFFGIWFSQFLIYLLIDSGLNNWFIIMTLGIFYIGILLIFIEKGKNKIIPILFVVPLFAFFILANNNIIKKETTGFHSIKYFETEAGQYFVVDKNNKVCFFRNFKIFFKFPYKGGNIKHFLIEKNLRFGDVLILNNNPAIINEFIKVGLFNMDYYIGEEKYYFELAYDFPEIIRTLMESNVRIIHSKSIFSINKKYDLIILPQYNNNEIFSKYFHRANNLLQLLKKIKGNGNIISIGNKNSFSPPFFKKFSDNIFILRKTEKDIMKLINTRKKNILKNLLFLILSFILLIIPIFIVKKRGVKLLFFILLLFSSVYFSFNIYINNNFNLYDNLPLIFTLFFAGVWSSYLFLHDIIISKLKITVLILIPLSILVFLFFYFNLTAFYLGQFISGFLFTGLFLSLKIDFPKR